MSSSGSGGVMVLAIFSGYLFKDWVRVVQFEIWCWNWIVLNKVLQRVESSVLIGGWLVVDWG